MVVFAQIFVKPWSWVLKQRGWLEINDLHLLDFGMIEGFFKDPDSKNNEEF